QSSVVEKTVVTPHPSAMPCYTDARPSASHNLNTDGVGGSEVDPDVAAADDPKEVEVVHVLLPKLRMLPVNLFVPS
ncbi:hypothetical protein A2U01_0071651, partial [Trifolium medium]|nr:hypothetical protein [Trifolium medium]